MDLPPAPAPARVRATALLVAAIILPAGLNLWLYWLHNPLYGHGLWVAPLAALLAWRRLGAVRPAVPSWPGAATAVIVACVALLPWVRVVQIANPDWRLLDWTLAGLAVVALLALSYRLGGRPAAAALWFPICFLLTGVPWSTSLERAFTDRAVPATATVASELLWTAGIAAVDDGRMLRTALGPVEVSEDCSGIRGVQLAVMGALFWAGWLEFRWWRVAALLASALGLAMLLNVLRVVAITLAAQHAGRLDVAEQWHDPAGTAAQLALVFGLPVLAWALRGKPAPGPTADASPAVPWGTVSKHAALAAVLWVGVGEMAAEWWFRRNEGGDHAVAAHWSISHPAPIMGATEQAIAAPIRRNYRYTDGQSLAWTDGQGAPWSLLWLEFARGAQSACTHNVHRPEWCLPAQNCVLVKEFADLPVMAAGRTIPFHHQFYARRDQAFHLFFTTVQDIPTGGERTFADWTFAGRLRVAWLGLRSQRSQMIHLSRQGHVSPVVARREAADYLRRLIVPAAGS